MCSIGHARISDPHTHAYMQLMRVLVSRDINLALLMPLQADLARTSPAWPYS